MVKYFNKTKPKGNETLLRFFLGTSKILGVKLNYNFPKNGQSNTVHSADFILS